MKRQALSEKDDERNEHQDERRAAAEVDVDATSFVEEISSRSPRRRQTTGDERWMKPPIDTELINPAGGRTIIPTASSLRETLLVGLRLLVVR
jgi:hypothetical protein